MFGWSEYCEAGGLLSYGANQREAYVRLATTPTGSCAANLRRAFLSSSRPNSS